MVSARTTTTTIPMTRSKSFVRRRPIVSFAVFTIFVAVYQFPLLSVPLETTSLEQGGKATQKFDSFSGQSHWWWDEYVDKVAQAFQPWNRTNWCHIDAQQSARLEKRAHEYGSKQQLSSTRVLQGLMLAKVHKAASTTSAGVTLRIAHRVAYRRLTAQNMTIHPYVAPMCQAHFFHDFTTHNYHSKRNFDQSFLWGTVRLPHSRSESAFYYYVPPQHYDDDAKHLEFLARSRGHQVRLLRKRSRGLYEMGGHLWKDQQAFDNSIENNNNNNNNNMGVPSNSMIQNHPDKLAYQHILKEILEFYDFIAVTERWAESMAVLKLLLPEVQYSDLIVLRVKESGTYVPTSQTECKFVPKPPLTPHPTVQTYLNTDFRATNPDYLLYAAVNRSLDLTIDKLGRDLVEDGVKQIEYLQALAQDRCQDQIVGACTDTGRLRPHSERNCYVKDFACAHRCLDRVLP